MELMRILECEQTEPDGRHDLVCHLPSFGLHRLGHYPQQPFNNAERLNRFWTERTADKQTTGCVSIHSVFSGKCAWRETFFAPATVFIDVESVDTEMFKADVMAAKEFARIQSCAIHDYCHICAQALKLKHNSEVP